jgi:methionine-gamma-lyase
LPIYQTTSFVFDSADHAASLFNLQTFGNVYSRISNPTVCALEERVAALEGGRAALAASSGMAAQTAALLTLAKQGDHIVAARTLYGGTYTQFAVTFAELGIETTFVDPDEPEAFQAALKPNTKALYAETIGNPQLNVVDLEALAQVAHRAGVPLVIDNTLASPFLCRPIEHGADIVVHSATKYLGGHDDVTLGLVVSASPETHHTLWKTAVDLGVAADPFAAWLTVRGLKTLSLRMARHCENAAFLAERLAAHPAVAAVHWPGLPSHPDHAVARRLLSGYGGMVAFDVAAGREAGLRFISALRLAAMAPSLGGVETLVLHPASTSHRQLDAAGLRAAGIGEGSIRVSVGLEHPEDLWGDFEQALAAAPV